MTENDNTNETAGATFYRCALQVNPAHYAKTYRDRDHGLSEEEYTKAILEKCCELRIDVIAITDHNHAGSVEFFAEKAKPFGITVFPGFEVESADGIHVLCLYSPGTTSAQLIAYLGDLGIIDISIGNDSTSKESFKDLLACVKDQNGQTIAAHVTMDKGLLKTLNGKTRINAWKDPNLLCVQIPASYDQIGDEYKKIIKNIDPNYKREKAATEDLAIAVVNAKDVVEPNDLASPTATCWIKMEKPTIEGLRQAFLDPASRIRLHSDAQTKPSIVFKEISWKGGLLDGCHFKFNKNLNTIIGGRGSGKSTIIESLRYVLGLNPKVPEMEKIYKDIVKDVLKEGTQVTLQVQVNSPEKQEYWLQGTIPNKPNIMPMNNEKHILQHKATEMFPNLQILGQHELSEFTKHPSVLTDLLRSFVDTSSISEIKERKELIKRSLIDSCQDITALTREKNRLEDNATDFIKYKEKLDTFNKIGLRDKYKEKLQIDREKHLLETTGKKINNVVDLILIMKEKSKLAEKYSDEFNPTEELTATGRLEIFEIISSLETEIISLANKLELAKNSALERFNKLSADWQKRFDFVENYFSAALRELQEDNKAFDVTKEFIETSAKIESMKYIPVEQDKNTTKLNKAKEKRITFVSQWDKIKAEEFRKISSTAGKISINLENHVRIGVKFSSAKEGLSVPLNVFKNDLKGVRIKDMFERLANIENFSLSHFANSGRAGAENLITSYNLAGNQANHLAGMDDCFWMSVEEAELPITTIIELNVSSDKKRHSWKKLDDLSTGQKATALLLLLLQDSQAPLIIDQPEDDLDNRFITDTIVARIKKEKFSRQMIFTTHNANIPVLGDAELIISLPSNIESSNEGVIRGALDSEGVRKKVEEVLEGGKQAFERRREKYGF